jgi:hypothetical protein
VILDHLAEIGFDAELADASAPDLRRVMEGLEVRDWPRRFREMPGDEVFQALADVASRSGAAAFLLLQGFVAGIWMPQEDVARVGVALGHLRDPSQIRLSERDGRLWGEVPWLSGSDWFDEAMLGWVDAEGFECIGRVPITDRPEFLHRQAMELIGLRSTRTVSVQVQGLPAPGVLQRNPLGTMSEGDRRGAVWQTPLMFGLITAALREIAECGERAPRLAAAAAGLREEADRALRHGCSAARAATIRTRAARLAAEAARRAVLASRGKGILAGSAPERLARESLVIGQMAMTAPLRARALNEAVR